MVCAQQSKPSKETVTLTPPPGNMRLLPGYTHKKLSGVDAAYGYISREGVRVDYIIGGTAGNGVNLQKGEKIVWWLEQTINKRKFIVVRTENRIYVTFTELYANFIADVKNENEAMQVLLMVLTFKDEPNCPR